MSHRLAGQVAIVTGAAGAIGQAIARRLLDEGAEVMLSDRDEKRLRSASADLLSRPQARLFPANIAERLDTANLLSATEDAFGKIDILVNAARQFATTDPLNPDDPSLDSLFALNLRAGLRLSQLTAQRMLAQQHDPSDLAAMRGSILSLTTLPSGRSRADLLGLSMASAGVEAMTRSLAQALGPQGIRVNALALGIIAGDGFLPDSEAVEPVARANPLRRAGAPADVANAVAYLVSSDASFVTGQILTLDGARASSL